MNSTQPSTHLGTLLRATEPARTMSSREIADLTGSTHDNVLKTVRKLVKEGVVFGNETPYVHEQNGQTYKEFHFDYRNTMIVVSGYSVELRAKIIDRWIELEAADHARPVMPDFSDPKVLLGAFQHLQEQVVLRDGVIAEQGQRLKKLDRLEGADGSMCITDAAKTLGVRRDDLIKFMRARRWIYKRPGNKNWVAFADRLQSGFMEHDDHIYFDSANHERVSTRALVTAKGLVRLAELLEEKPH